MKKNIRYKDLVKAKPEDKAMSWLFREFLLSSHIDILCCNESCVGSGLCYSGRISGWRNYSFGYHSEHFEVISLTVTDQVVIPKSTVP